MNAQDTADRPWGEPTLAFCPFIIILHQFLELQGFFAHLSRKETIFCSQERSGWVKAGFLGTFTVISFRYSGNKSHYPQVRP